MEPNRLPILAGQQVVRSGKPKEAVLYGIAHGLGGRRAAKGLADDRLHRRKRILHAMIELIDEQIAAGLFDVVFGDIGERYEMLHDGTVLIRTGLIKTVA